ncbi:histidine phosphatase family protein [Flindersiella endophytica]
MKTIVHLLRHGEVDNPAKILYGRLPGYHLSPLGRKMAERIAESVVDRKIVHLGASPLERAQETALPIATTFGMPVATDDRLIEAANLFEGQKFGLGDGALRHPGAWWHLRNPLRPSWGEPYRDIVVRMLAAMGDARKAAEGREALLVSHQLPIWTVRSYVEGRRLWHDPRKRECTLASLTSFVYDGDRIVSVEYSEPAGDLLPVQVSKKFVAGA